MSEYEKLKEILDNAPENAFAFKERGTKVDYYICIDEEGNYDKYYPDHDITQPFEGGMSSVDIRRLSDIKTIVGLKVKVALALVYAEKIIEDLSDE